MIIRLRRENLLICVNEMFICDPMWSLNPYSTDGMRGVT